MLLSNSTCAATAGCELMLMQLITVAQNRSDSTDPQWVEAGLPDIVRRVIGAV